MLKFAIRAHAVFLLTISLTFTALAETPRVVASIPPVHSLVATILDGIASPQLIVDGFNSPHDYAMTPSEAGMVAHADIIFWTGPDLEGFLVKPLKNVSKKTRIVALMEEDDHDGKTHKEEESSHAEAKHEHEHEAKHEHEHEAKHEHEHEAKHEHEHEAKHEHEHEAKHEHEHEAKHEHEQENEHGHHHHGDTDPHFWMSPDKAIHALEEISETIVDAYPEYKAQVTANRDKAISSIKKMDRDIIEILKPVQNARAVVLHDAYSRFTTHYGLQPFVALTLTPEKRPGPVQLQKVRDLIKEHNIKCVFREPQFPKRYTNVLTEGSTASQGTLDPLGGGIEPGPGQYRELMLQIAKSFRNCIHP